MRLKSVCLAAAALLSLAAPATALADPEWGRDASRGPGWDHDGWRPHEHHEHAWRDEHAWREHEPWARPAAWGGYGGPRCVVEDHGFYDWYGRYVPRPVQVCYR
jgi:hypothetical protein